MTVSIRSRGPAAIVQGCCYSRRFWCTALLVLSSAVGGIALTAAAVTTNGRTRRGLAATTPDTTDREAKGMFGSVKKMLRQQSTPTTMRGGSSRRVMLPKRSLNATIGLTSSSPTYHQSDEYIVGDPSQSRGPLKILFLSADTGGGHRASAESLAKQFMLHYPGSTYDLLDVWTNDGCYPYKTLVPAYQHLSANPTQWRMLYHITNSLPWELAVDLHSTLACEAKIRRRIESYNPDVIVSVHPAMNNVPMIATRKISQKLGKHIPFFTVVTDLGSAHCTWFHRKVEKLYVASDRLWKLAKRRGRTPDEKIVMSGLPIRHDFAIQAERLGDRTLEAGIEYQTAMKKELNLDPSKPMVLLMGGGEGVGSLETIVEHLYVSFTKQGLDATICVVCGRNEKLQNTLANQNWDDVLTRHESDALRPHRRSRLERMFSFLGRRRSRKIQESLDRAAEGDDSSSPKRKGQVDVVGLGFVTRMAEYMVAANVLVTKAGPGTIAEAAAVGLPIMLTSFLPGQEAGNVDYVLDNGFGDFNSHPVEIAQEVACWLQDRDLLNAMSKCAQAAGHPHAAADIVLDIGSITHCWMALNNAKKKEQPQPIAMEEIGMGP